jgi:hypothetical protein
MMDKQKRILIVTDDFDPHADIMIVMLRQMGHFPIRLHPADFPKNSHLSFTLTDRNWNGTIQTRGKLIDLDEICSIWWRKPTSYKLPEGLTEEEEKFLLNELQHTLQGLWVSLQCYWMSFPFNIRLASYKLGQLKRASQLGFKVPRTLITTDPDSAKDFYELCNNKIIYKVLSIAMLGPNSNQSKSRAVYTTPIEASQLTLLNKDWNVPCQFQEYIPKRLELRVTVIGDELFAAEIHSQAHERTRKDWRHYDVVTPMRKGNLPSDIAEMCFALTKSYGLNFSTIDLILTPEEEYVFLEINPNGQWIWVEERVPELKMKEALAYYLIRGLET